jgi:hypothetical protein
MTKFLTASELARLCGVPASVVLRAVQRGAIAPAGRAGASKHAPMIFSSEDVDMLRLFISHQKVFCSISEKPSVFRACAEIREKSKAIRRAIQTTK